MEKRELFRELIKKFADKAPRKEKVEIPLPEKIEGFGKLIFDPEKCWGCAACKVQCSAEALRISENWNTRVVTLDCWKCVGCKECVDTCPKEAIRFERVFDLQSFLSEPLVCIEVEVHRCLRCGNTIATVPELVEVGKKGIALNKFLTYRVSVSSLCENCKRELTATFILERWIGR